MDAAEFAERARESFETNGDLDIRRITTYAEGGVMTSNEGMTVSLRDGSEFQITIVQSKFGANSSQFGEPDEPDEPSVGESVIDKLTK